MREFVVGCQSLEHNRLLVLLVQVRVLRFEEDQLVICANDDGDGSIMSLSEMHRTIIRRGGGGVGAPLLTD